MPTLTEIQSNMQERLTLLDGEASRLQKALEALGGRVDPQPPAQASERPSEARRAPAEGEAVQVVLAGKLVRQMKQDPGQTSARYATALGGSSKQVLALLKEMEGAGAARRSGMARGTRWYPVET